MDLVLLNRPFLSLYSTRFFLFFLLYFGYLFFPDSFIFGVSTTFLFIGRVDLISQPIISGLVIASSEESLYRSLFGLTLLSLVVSGTSSGTSGILKSPSALPQTGWLHSLSPVLLVLSYDVYPTSLFSTSTTGTTSWISSFNNSSN